jgi:AcrR family transcriptional regulator
MTPSPASYAPATPSLRSLRRERTRDEIAQAALELIRRKGYGDTLVEDIAARALISPRTFYRYFPAKEDAFFHGLPAFEDALSDFSSSAARGNLAASLAAAGEAFADAVEAQRDSVLPRLPHALSEPALLGQLVHRLYAAESRLARRLRPLVPAGAPRAWTAEVLAAAITATLMAALRRWQSSPKPPGLGALVKQGMATLEPVVATMDKD